MEQFGKVFRRCRRNARDPEHPGAVSQDRLMELIQKRCREVAEEAVRTSTLTDDRFGKLFAERFLDPDYSMSRQTISNWEKNKNYPDARYGRGFIMIIIEVLVMLGGLTQRTDADSLLAVHRYERIIDQEWENLVRSGQERYGAAVQVQTPTSHSLSIHSTNFIGRQSEMHQIRQLLNRQRLVTLVGTAGIGKTRLALEVANFVKDDFLDGVSLIRLETLDRNSDIHRINQVLASEFGLQENQSEDLAETLKRFLSRKHLLLVLDNCEHVIAVAAQAVNDLLERCPNLKILATSREPLRVRGEQLWFVNPLSTPAPRDIADLGQDLVPALMKFDAVRLFLDRCHEAVSNYMFTSVDAIPVAQVCRRLDGIPLALELAAARFKVLSIGQIAQRLDNRFKLLTTGSHTAERRQQTLQATIDWSYDLLSDPEKSLLTRLTIFAGSFTLDAVEDVCSDERIPKDEILDLLSSLIAKSLVNTERYPGDIRYSLFETIKAYGREKLSEDDSIFHRIVECYVRFLENHTIDYSSVDAETPNIESALQYAVTRRSFRSFVKGARNYSEYLRVKGFYSAAEDYVQQGLQIASQINDHESAVALKTVLAFIAVNRGQYPLAKNYLEENLGAARILGMREYEGIILMNLGVISIDTGHAPEAVEYLEHSLNIARELNQEKRISLVLSNLAVATLTLGDYPKAMGYWDEALATARKFNDYDRMFIILTHLGETAFSRGEFELVEKYGQDALKIARDIHNREHISNATRLLGLLAIQKDELSLAQDLLNEALEQGSEIGNPTTITRARWGLAKLESVHGNDTSSENLFAESLTKARELENLGLVSEILSDWGEHHLRHLRVEDGLAKFEESLDLARGVGDPELIGVAGYGFGRALFVHGEVTRACTQVRASLEQLQKVGHYRTDEVQNWLALHCPASGRRSAIAMLDSKTGTRP